MTSVILEGISNGARHLHLGKGTKPFNRGLFTSSYKDTCIESAMYQHLDLKVNATRGAFIQNETCCLGFEETTGI